MPSNPTEAVGSDPKSDARRGQGALLWIPLTLSALILVWFYQFEYRYGPGRGQSAFEWIMSAWNKETDYEHGLLFPPLIAGLIIYRWKDLKAAVGPGSLWGLVSILIGVAFYAAAYRTLQPRIAMGALPFLVWGSAYYLWGWKVAKILLFPIFFFWLAVPLPSFQQAHHPLAVDRHFHGPSWRRPLWGRNHRAGKHDRTRERKLETAGDRRRMQRESARSWRC